MPSATGPTWLPRPFYEGAIERALTTHDIVVLLGPRGAGTSSLARRIATQTFDFAGEVEAIDALAATGVVAFDHVDQSGRAHELLSRGRPRAKVVVTSQAPWRAPPGYSVRVIVVSGLSASEGARLFRAVAADVVFAEADVRALVEACDGLPLLLAAAAARARVTSVRAFLGEPTLIAHLFRRRPEDGGESVVAGVDRVIDALRRTDDHGDACGELIHHLLSATSLSPTTPLPISLVGGQAGSFVTLAECGLVRIVEDGVDGPGVVPSALLLAWAAEYVDAATHTDAIDTLKALVTARTVALTKELHGPDSSAVIHELTRLAPLMEAVVDDHERQPVRAAQAMLGLTCVPPKHGPFEVLVEKLEAVVRALGGDTAASVDEERTRLVARLYLALATLRFHRADLEGAADAAVTAVGLAGSRDNATATEAGTVLMLALQYRGEASVEPHHVDGEPVAVTFYRAVRALHRGDPATCELLASERLKRIPHRATVAHVGRLLALRGVAEHELCQLQRATATLRSAAARLRADRDTHFGAICDAWFALVQHELGKSAAAARRLERVLERVEAIGDAFYIGSIHGYLGLVQLSLGAQSARGLLERATVHSREMHDAYRFGLFAPILAMLNAADGRFEAAKALVDECRALLSSPVNPFVVAFSDIASCVLAALRDESAPARAALSTLLGSLNRPSRAADGGETTALFSQSSDVRFVVSIARRFVRDVDVDASRSQVTIGKHGLWFDVDGSRVELHTRRGLARLLWTLALLKEQPMTTEDLVSRVWPGEQLVKGSGAHRVHVAISTLRRMGLSRFMVRRDGAYALVGDVNLDQPRIGGPDAGEVDANDRIADDVALTDVYD